MRLSSAELQEREAQQREAAARRLRDEMGLRRVLALLTAAALPVVGHNMFYDLLFTLEALDAPLPGRLTDFRLRMAEVFPGGVLDTKLLALCPRDPTLTAATVDVHRSTVLGDLYAALEAGRASDGPLVAHGAGFDRYEDPSMQDRLHEAGWDAFITGTAALHLAEKFVVGVDADGGPVKAGGGLEGLDALCEHAGNVLYGMFTPTLWRLGPDEVDGITAELRGGCTLVVEGGDSTVNDQALAHLFGVGQEPVVSLETNWIDERRVIVSLFPQPGAPLLSALAAASRFREALPPGSTLSALPWHDHCDRIDAADEPTAPPPPPPPQQQPSAAPGFLGWVRTVLGRKRRRDEADAPEAPSATARRTE